ncbi:MAG TPA: PLP-dependent aminotransferase family protein, partial [Blastocatellia bacterium]
YQELWADGLIVSHVGRGTFISAIPAPSRTAARTPEPAALSPMHWNLPLAPAVPDRWLGGLPQSAPREGAVSFVCALPDPELMPLEEFRRCVDRALRKMGRLVVDFGPAAGYCPLREYIAAQASLSGRAVGPEQIMITGGCQQSLNLIRQVLVPPGDEVVIEAPTYPGALSVFCEAGSKYTSVPVGEHGMDLGVLADVLSQRRPRLIYTVPSFHNPTGVTMDLSSRRKLVELAAKHRVPLIEDDIYGELRYDGPSVPPLRALDPNGVVIHINSFSKVGFVGLRVGWIIAEPPVIEALTVVKRKTELQTSLLAQASIYEFARHGLLARHIKRLKKVNAQRRDVMLSAIERYFPIEATWTRPEGGMSIWITLPESLNTTQVLIESMEKGVTFSPGEHFHPTLSPGNSMRLAFATVGPAQIEESIKRLGAILKSRISALKKRRAAYGHDGLRPLV